MGGFCGGAYASRPHCGAHVPPNGGSELNQALKVDRKQAHQGEMSSSKRRTSFTVGLCGQYGNKRAKRIAEHPYTPASYAVLSKTRVMFDAVLINERGAMPHPSRLRPMIAFQPPASAPAGNGDTLLCKGRVP